MAHIGSAKQRRLTRVKLQTRNVSFQQRLLEFELGVQGLAASDDIGLDFKQLSS